MRNRIIRVFVFLCVVTGLFGSIVTNNSVEARPNLTAIAGVSVSSQNDVFIGEPFTFTVTFDNTGDTTGYGPYIDLIFPTSGMDGDDGITFLNATYLGLPVITVDLLVQDTAPLNDGLGCITHPYAKDATGNFIQICDLQVGDHFVTLLLPFGSFVPNQTPAELTINASMSNLADLGEDLAIISSGGYIFGNDPLDNPISDPSIIGAPSINMIIPTLFTLTKVYNGPENETATGPNYLRTYTIDVDVASGQVLENFDLMDYLPGNVQFVSILSSNPSYSLPESYLPSTSNPGGEIGLFYPSVNGNSDLQVVVQFYIPLSDENSARVIDPFSGNDVFSCNQVSGLGDWDPIDTRDEGAIDNAQAGSNDGNCNNELHENELEDKSIATQKSVRLFSDQNAIGPSPDDILEYTIELQISDYFGFDDLIFTDTFSDGQHWDESFQPTFTINGNQFSLSGNFANENYLVDRSEIGNDTDPDSDGTTTVTFNFSDQLSQNIGISWMVGGCVPMVAGGGARDVAINPGLNPDCAIYNNGATTATITFRTIIQEEFTDTYPSGDSSVDQGDVLTNSLQVAGNILSVEDLSRSGYQSEADSSSASIGITYGDLSKSIYAYNGSTSFTQPLLVAPGDTITYRIQYTLPTSDFESLQFVDYLPLPVFDATDVSTTFDAVVSATAPLAGQAKFGPNDTFYAYSNVVPVITTNGSQNSITFNYFNYDSVVNQFNRIDILFSVQVKDDPFADGLYLTNQISATENSTNAGTNSENAIVQIQLTEPVLNFSKGIVWVSGDQMQASFSPANVGPVAFTYNPANPTDCNRFTGTISSDNLRLNPIQSDLSGVDAGDIALMTLVVENTGSGLNGAFDVTLTDSLPSGLNFIPGSLCVVDGSGVAFTYSGDLFGAGLRLDDPGPTSIPLGALDPFHTSSGRNIALVTYAVSIDSDVTPDETLTNLSALTNFAGAEGGEDHTNTDLEDSATISTLSPTFDKTLTSTEINSAANGTGQAVIGELVTYTMTATFPEGLTESVSLVDLLDSGLAFVDLVSVTASSGISSTVMSFNPSGLCTNCFAGTNPLVVNNGQQLTFNFGDIRNANIDNNVSETITIVYRSVVLNVISNQSGSVLNNSAELSWLDDSIIDSSENITVVEPDLTITKSYQRTSPAPAALTPVDAGDEITYTIVISNTSTIDAFDVVVSDVLPTTSINPWTIVGVTDTAGTLTITDFSIAGGILSTVPTSAFDLLANNARTVTIQVRGTVLDTIVPNQAISNTATVTWTSLDTNQENRSPYNDASDERNGSNGIGSGLNNYAENSNTLNFNIRALSGAKYFVSSSESGTSDTASPPRLTIGEVVRYRLAMQIPEGTSSDLAMLDQLPQYLRFLNDGTAKFAFVSQAGLSSTTLTTTNIVGSAADLTAIPSTSIVSVLPDSAISSSRTTNADTYGSGTDIYFKLGTITNIEDNDTDAEFIIVEFNALVENDAANQAYNNTTGAATADSNRLNNFRGYLNVSTTNNLAFTSGNVTIRIAEPSITNLDKVISSPSPAIAEAGDTINYAVTFSNVSGANASPAFDVTFTDVVHSKLSLVIASVNINSACALGVINNTAGNNINVFFSQLPTGCAVTITYSASVRSTVIPGETLNNSSRVIYSSIPGNLGTSPNPTGSTLVSGINDPGTVTGERTSTGGVNDYVDTDLIGLAILQVSPQKALLSSNDINTIGNDLTIGETARYRLEILLRQATSPSFRIRDYLPDGMIYLDDGQTNLAFVSENGISSDTLSGIGLNQIGNEINLATITPTFALSSLEISLIGNDPIFALGTLLNTDNDDNNEYVVLEFNAQLVNEIGNQLTIPVTTKTNYFTVSIDGAETGPSNNVITNVVEPRIETNKSVNPNSGVQAGDIISYTVNMTNTGTSMAYDVTFRDVLAQGVQYNSSSMVCLLNGLEISNTVIANSTELNVTSNPDGLWDIPVGQTLVCTYTVTALPTLTIDGDHTNTVDADWSSLNGDSSEERDYDDSIGYNTDGVQDTSSAIFSVNAPTLSKSVVPDIATIGQTVTYTITIESPLGTLQNMVVQDTLPAGMIFSGTPNFNGLTAPVQTIINDNDGLSEVIIQWDFDDEVISSSPVSITYQAIVANVPSNQQGIVLTNEAYLEYTDADNNTATTATASDDVNLVEPALTINKTFNETDVPFDAGDPIIYTLLISNTSGTTAYDAVVSDTVFGTSPTVNSVNVGTSGAITNASFSGNDLTVTIDQLDNNESITISIQVTLPESVIPGQTVQNQASVSWTSLADDNNENERNGDDGAGGALDDYATSDQTSFIIDVVSIEKSIISTSQFHTANQDLAIGETATFEILVTFPEGTITSPISVVDQLPAGLNLLEVIEIDLSHLNANIASGDPVDNSILGLAGQIKIDFTSDLVLLPNNDGTDNILRIVYETRLENINGNQNNQTWLNGASLSWDEQSPLEATPVEVTVVEPELQVIKSADVTTPTYGQTIHYSLTVSHLPTSTTPAFNIVVSDFIPAGLSYVSSPISIQAPIGWVVDDSNAPILTWQCSSPVCSLAITETATLSYDVTVDLPPSSDPNDVLTNQVNMTWSSLPNDDINDRDGSGGINDYQDDTAVDVTLTSPDLVITKTDGVTTYVPGTNLVYSIIVSNVGNGPAFNAVIFDSIPSQFIGWSWSCVQTGGASGCSTYTGAGDFSNIVNVPTGATITYTVNATIAPSATLDLVNTVSVTPEGGLETDPSPLNNSATDSDTQDSQADLNISKDDGVLSYIPGGSLTYTITVANTGPSDAPGSMVSDLIPDQFSSWEWSCTSITGFASGCDPMTSFNGDFLDTINLPVGSSITYTVIAQIASSATGDLTNTVTVSTAPNITDPTPGNNSDSDLDQQDSQANLAVFKDDGVSTYVPGDSLTYTIIVSNLGPSDAPGSVISDQIPPQFSAWTWSCIGATGSASGCDSMASSNANFNDIVDLPIGSSITYSVNAQIASSATGELTNTVDVATAAGITDTDLLNNSSSDVDTQDSQLDLSISKDDGITQFVPGETLVYTIVVANDGPSDAPGSLVSDNIPAQFSSWVWTCVNENGASGCDGMAESSSNFSDEVNLPANSQITYTVTANILSSASGNLVNSVIVNPGIGITETNPLNNEATDTDTQNSISDLGIEKSVSETEFLPGGTVTYQLQITNYGPSVANNVVVTETVPDHTIFVPTAGWTCDPVSGLAGATCTNNVGDLDANESVSVQFVVTIENPIPADVTEFTNNVSVDSDSEDSDLSNNEDDLTLPLEATPDMTITKDDGFVQVAPGSSITYTIVVANEGNQTATNVEVIDQLPAGVTFISASNGGIYDDVLHEITWLFPEFEGQTSRTLTVQITVDNPFPSETNEILNQVFVEDDGSNGVDPTPENNQAQDLDLIGSMGKMISATNQDHTGLLDVAVGEIVTYQVDLTIAPGDVENQVENLVFEDILSQGFAFIGCTSITTSVADALVFDPVTNYTLNSLCTMALIGNYPAESTNLIDQGRRMMINFGDLYNSSQDDIVLTIEYQVVVLNTDDNISGQDLINQASWDWNGGSLELQAPSVTVVEPDLEIRKLVNPTSALSGEIVTYTIAIKHSDASETDAFNVLINDLIPPQLTYVPGSLRFMSGVAPDVLSNINNPYLRIGWDRLPLSTNETIISYQARITNANPGQTIVNNATLEWTSLPGDVPNTQTPFNPYGSERSYIPGSNVDTYGVSANAQLRIPELPDTGFAAGVITRIPEQPASSQYQALGDLRLAIPKQNLDLPIIGIPLNETGWDLTWLSNQIGYLEGTAYPTWSGNTGLTGHVYNSDGSAGPFVNLHLLKWGDKILLHAYGRVYTYEVRSVERVGQFDTQVLKHKNSSTLTLITCQGYDEEKDQYTWRIAVQAVLISVN